MPLDPRTNRADLQSQQANHRPARCAPETFDHDLQLRAGLARARNPEAVVELLERAARLIRPQSHEVKK